MKDIWVEETMRVAYMLDNGYQYREGRDSCPRIVAWTSIRSMYTHEMLQRKDMGNKGRRDAMKGHV